MLYTTTELMCILEIIEDALEGDDSTGFMPDVTPGQAARWSVQMLDKKGYAIIRTNDPRLLVKTEDDNG